MIKTNKKVPIDRSHNYYKSKSKKKNGETLLEAYVVINLDIKSTSKIFQYYVF